MQSRGVSYNSEWIQFVKYVFFYPCIHSCHMEEARERGLELGVLDVLDLIAWIRMYISKKYATMSRYTMRGCVGVSTLLSTVMS
jgi:hypothetical protein